MKEQPKSIQNVAFCPHCGNTALQNLVYKHTYDATVYDMNGEKSDDGPQCSYFVAVCTTCNELLLYHNWLDESEAEQFSWCELLHPHKNFLSAKVPAPVREAYAEAFRIRTIAPNGYAVLLRRSLEAVCDDRNVPPGVLHKRLSVLVERGELPATLAKMTTMLRTLGNAGAHHSSTSVTVPMTWGMDEFFRAVIEYVYIAPSKIMDFQQRMERIKSVPEQDL